MSLKKSAFNVVVYGFALLGVLFTSIGVFNVGRSFSSTAGETHLVRDIYVVNDNDRIWISRKIKAGGWENLVAGEVSHFAVEGDRIFGMSVFYDHATSQWLPVLWMVAADDSVSLFQNIEEFGKAVQVDIWKMKMMKVAR